MSEEVAKVDETHKGESFGFMSSNTEPLLKNMQETTSDSDETPIHLVATSPSWSFQSVSSFDSESPFLNDCFGLEKPELDKRHAPIIAHLGDVFTTRVPINVVASDVSLLNSINTSEALTALDKLGNSKPHSATNKYIVSKSNTMSGGIEQLVYPVVTGLPLIDTCFDTIPQTALDQSFNMISTAISEWTYVEYLRPRQTESEVRMSSMEFNSRSRPSLIDQAKCVPVGTTGFDYNLVDWDLTLYRRPLREKDFMMPAIESEQLMIRGMETTTPCDKGHRESATGGAICLENSSKPLHAPTLHSKTYQDLETTTTATNNYATFAAEDSNASSSDSDISYLNEGDVFSDGLCGYFAQTLAGDLITDVDIDRAMSPGLAAAYKVSPGHECVASLAYELEQSGDQIGDSYLSDEEYDFQGKCTDMYEIGYVEAYCADVDGGSDNSHATTTIHHLTGDHHGAFELGDTDPDEIVTTEHDWTNGLARTLIGTESLLMFLHVIKVNVNPFGDMTKLAVVTTFLELVNLERLKLGEALLPLTCTAASILRSQILLHTTFLGIAPLSGFLEALHFDRNSTTTLPNVYEAFQDLSQQDSKLREMATTGAIGAFGRAVGKLI